MSRIEKTFQPPSKSRGHSGNLRAEKWVREAFPGLSRSMILEAFDQGWIRSPAGFRLKAGVKLDDLKKLDSSRLAQRVKSLSSGADVLGVRVIDRQSDFLVLHKPSGVPSQPLGLLDRNTVTDWMLYHFQGLPEAFGYVRPELAVHRLDIGTTGLLIVAMTRDAFHRWRAHFSEGKVQKTYLAWISDKLPVSSQVVSGMIGSIPGDPTRVQVMPKHLAGGREAVSTVEETGVQVGGYTLVRVHCSTGVRHQVRVHLASLGTPIVGDTQYGKSPRLDGGTSSHMLWASELQTPEGKWTDFPPSDWVPMRKPE